MYRFGCVKWVFTEFSLVSDTEVLSSSLYKEHILCSTAKYGMVVVLDLSLECC